MSKKTGKPATKKAAKQTPILQYQTVMREYFRTQPQRYFSTATVEMLKKLEKMSAEEARRKYIVFTPLHKTAAIGAFVDTFNRSMRLYADTQKENKEKGGDGEDTKMSLPDFQALATLVDTSAEDLAIFWNILTHRFINQEFTFIAYTIAQDSSGLYDIAHYMDTPKLLTTSLCNGCGRSDCVLHLCPCCKRAAYCRKACQEEDWSFHAEFCALLAETRLEISPVEEVVDEVIAEAVKELKLT